jgi:ribonucleotide monophosphatase NagD (HAD superfamily)
MSVRSFSGQVVRATRPLQTVFVDLWGPVTSSMEGFVYALLLVDEFTSYTWVYFLSNKGQASEHVLSFIREQAQDENKVARIRADRKQY